MTTCHLIVQQTRRRRGESALSLAFAEAVNYHGEARCAEGVDSLRQSWVVRSKADRARIVVRECDDSASKVLTDPVACARPTEINPRELGVAAASS